VSTIILYLDEKSLDFGAYMSLLLYIYACACTFVGRGAYVCIMWEILQIKRYLIY